MHHYVRDHQRAAELLFLSPLLTVPSLCSNSCPVMVMVFNPARLPLHSISHQYPPPPSLLFSSLPTGMCEPAVGALQGKVHIRAHGSTDNIITMVTTGCGSSLGTLGESHTDSNWLKGTHINTAKANIHTQTFTHRCRGAGRSQGNEIQQNQTHGDEIPTGSKESIIHIYRNPLFMSTSS